MTEKPVRPPLEVYSLAVIREWFEDDLAACYSDTRTKRARCAIAVMERLAEVETERDRYKRTAEDGLQRGLETGSATVIDTAELATLRQQLEEARAEALKWRRIRTPTHGTCCTCQGCGLHYDDCKCTEEEIEDLIATLRADLTLATEDCAKLRRTDARQVLGEMDALKDELAKLEEYRRRTVGDVSNRFVARELGIEEAP
jgi:hypothetical protein